MSPHLIEANLKAEKKAKGQTMFPSMKLSAEIINLPKMMDIKINLHCSKQKSSYA
jgi:hypothetical protein